MSALTATATPTVQGAAKTTTRKRPKEATVTPLHSASRSTVPMTDLDTSKRAAVIMLITPQMALAWLALNVKNRPRNKGGLGRLITDALAGRFLFTGAAIQFSIEGRLLDGQHRLTMIVETGIPQEMVVVTGVETKAQAAMDSGTTRTLAHNLTMQRDISRFAATNLAATITITRAWEMGERTHDGSKGLTIATGLAWFDEHPELLELSLEATRLAAKLPVLTTKQVALFIWVFDKLDVDDRKDFFAKLASGAGMDDGNPVLTLRNKLLKIQGSRTETLTPISRLGITFKAWNAYREGVTVKNITFRGGGSNPEAFPEPF